MTYWYVVAIFGLLGGVIAGWAVQLYEGWQWRKYARRRLAETAEIIQRLDEEQ